MFSDGGVAIASFAILIFAPVILLGADYLFDEMLEIRGDLAKARHFRAFLYVAVIAVSALVILQASGSYSYLETFRVTSLSIIWIFAMILLTFFLGKWVLKQSWVSRERKRVEQIELELPQYLEMFHILITSGMSVLSALKILSQGSAAPTDAGGAKPASRNSGGTGSLGLVGMGIKGGNGFNSASNSKSKHALNFSSLGGSEMRRVVVEVIQGVEAGLAIERAIDQAVLRAGSEQLRRFGDAVVLGMERGSSMGQTVRNLINETRNQSKVLVMQRAGKAEIKLLIPVVFLILPISVMFAIWPSYMNLAQIMGG